MRRQSEEVITIRRQSEEVIVRIKKKGLLSYPSDCCFFVYIFMQAYLPTLQSADYSQQFRTRLFGKVAVKVVDYLRESGERDKATEEYFMQLKDLQQQSVILVFTQLGAVAKLRRGRVCNQRTVVLGESCVDVEQCS